MSRVGDQVFRHGDDAPGARLDQGEEVAIVAVQQALLVEPGLAAVKTAHGPYLQPAIRTRFARLVIPGKVIVDQ